MSAGYVLVVEDEPLVRRALVKLLARLDYIAEGAASATEAVAKIQKRRPAVVIADFVLPMHDGLWLLQQVRAKWPELPVVLMTGALLPDSSIDQARRQGAVAFLGKPFTREALYQALQLATGNNGNH